FLLRQKNSPLFRNTDATDIVPEKYLDRVLGIERGVESSRNPAARSQGKAFAHPAPLVVGSLISQNLRLITRVAYRKAGHTPRDLNILVKQERRQDKRVSNVIEAGFHRIDWQIRREIGIHRQQIPDRVAVLKPVQPPNNGCARIGMEDRRAIQLRFQTSDKRR